MTAWRSGPLRLVGVLAMLAAVAVSGCSRATKEAESMRAYRFASQTLAYDLRLRVNGQASLPGLAQLGALAGDSADKPVSVLVSADATLMTSTARTGADVVQTTAIQQLNGSVTTTLGRRGLSQKDLEKTGSTSFRQTITPLGVVKSTEQMPAALAALPGVTDLLGFGCPTLPGGQPVKPGDTWTVPAADGRAAEENSMAVATRRDLPVVELTSKRRGPVDTTADVGQVVAVIAGFDVGGGTVLKVRGTNETTTVCTFNDDKSRLLAVSANGRTEVDLAVDGSGLVASVLNGGHLSLNPEVQRVFDAGITPTTK